MHTLVQCLGQDEITMNYNWQIIDTKNGTTKIIETRHGSITDIPHTELPLNAAIKELPNPFVHWSGLLRK